MDKILLEHVQSCFTGKDLPGREVMLEMAPASRRKPFQIRDDHNIASVMLLLYPENGSLYFPLIVRTNNYPNDKHGGQIAFPGGKKEQSDATNWHCALRETGEELGILSKGIEKIGSLTPNYIPVSNYKVHPFVGYVPGMPEFNKQDDEVADIIEVRVEDIFDPGNLKTGKIQLASGAILTDIPYFDIAGNKVWGATAMILNEFRVLLNG